MRQVVEGSVLTAPTNREKRLGGGRRTGRGGDEKIWKSAVGGANFSQNYWRNAIRCQGKRVNSRRAK